MGTSTNDNIVLTPTELKELAEIIWDAAVRWRDWWVEEYPKTEWEDNPDKETFIPELIKKYTK